MRTNKQIMQSIDAWATSGSKWQERGQAILIECIEHAQEHSNTTLIANLLNSMPKGSRVERMKVYIDDHTPCIIHKDKDAGKYTVKLKKEREAEDYKLDAMSKVMWSDYVTKRESIEQLYGVDNITKSIESLLKRVQRELDAGHVDTNQRDNVVSIMDKLKELKAA